MLSLKEKARVVFDTGLVVLCLVVITFKGWLALSLKGWTELWPAFALPVGAVLLLLGFLSGQAIRKQEALTNGLNLWGGLLMGASIGKLATVFLLDWFS